MRKSVIHNLTDDKIKKQPTLIKGTIASITIIEKR